MKKLLYILFINNLAFSQNAILDTNTILIGEQTKFTITNPVVDTEIWPTYESSLVKGIEIIKASTIDTNSGIINQEFIITSWDSGNYYIPSINFSENNKTEGLLFNVQTVILKNDSQLKDIKQPINEPISWIDIWPWLLALSIISFIIYLLKRYFSSKKENKESFIAELTIPAHITALKELNKLDNEKIWQKGNIKEYHSKLSEIIRRYTENRFKFIALELTTDEILHELKPIISTRKSNKLKTILERADLAKFAKSKPVDAENTESMDLAKQFIKSTEEIKDDA